MGPVAVVDQAVLHTVAEAGGEPPVAGDLVADRGDVHPPPHPGGPNPSSAVERGCERLFDHLGSEGRAEGHEEVNLELRALGEQLVSQHGAQRVGDHHLGVVVDELGQSLPGPLPHRRVGREDAHQVDRTLPRRFVGGLAEHVEGVGAHEVAQQVGHARPRALPCR